MRSSKAKPKKQNAVIYTRVSTDEQAEKGYSLRYQDERLRTYCRLNDIEVVEHYQDDASAKTFERPAFQEFLQFINANADKVDLFIFLKWDRFARNAESAYAMIRLLESKGIMVYCVEQPVDLSVPENKFMLAFYLVAPEVENDRRGLNTMTGMRRAKLEGRWVGMAPKGYKNARDAANRPIVIPNDDARFIRLAYEKMAEGAYYMEEIRRELNRMGFVCSKNIFTKMLQNPFYIGKITVPAYRDEPEETVEGIHEALIDEALFYRVQDIIQRANGKRKEVPKRQHSELPLRGFLVCRQCGGNLTGSKTRGNGGQYYYYHCQHGCKERFRATEANDRFTDYLKAIKPPEEIALLYLHIMEDIFRQKEGNKSDALARVERDIRKQEERLTSATEKYIDDKIGADAYERLEGRLRHRLQELEAERRNLEEMETDFDRYARYGMALISDLPGYFQKAELPIQQKMVGLIFPEKLTYDQGNYRTTRLNEAIALFNRKKADIEAKNKGLTASVNDQPSEVALPGLEPGSS